MSGIHLLYRAPWDAAKFYAAPTGNHFWFFAHRQPFDRLSTRDSRSLTLVPSMVSEESTRKKPRGWVAMSRPVLHAVIPELRNRPRYQRIPTMFPGITLGQFAGWHHDTCRRVREMAAKDEVLAVWDECDYFRVRSVDSLRVEYMAVHSLPECENPFALMKPDGR